MIEMTIDTWRLRDLLKNQPDKFNHLYLLNDGYFTEQLDDIKNGGYSTIRIIATEYNNIPKWFVDIITITIVPIIDLSPLNIKFSPIKGV